MDFFYVFFYFFGVCIENNTTTNNQEEQKGQDIFKQQRGNFKGVSGVLNTIQSGNLGGIGGTLTTLQNSSKKKIWISFLCICLNFFSDAIRACIVSVGQPMIIVTPDGQALQARVMPTNVNNPPLVQKYDPLKPYQPQQYHGQKYHGQKYQSQKYQTQKYHPKKKTPIVNNGELFFFLTSMIFLFCLLCFIFFLFFVFCFI